MEERKEVGRPCTSSLDRVKKKRVLHGKKLRAAKVMRIDTEQLKGFVNGTEGCGNI